MHRGLLLWLACLSSLAVAASADIYRCEEPDGSVHFADDPQRCPGATRLRRAPAEAEDEAPERPARAEAGAGPQARPLPALRPEEILPPAFALAGSWEVVEEAPSDAAADPDLVRWGVREQRTRHYTRRDAAGVQVCSIEVWSFENANRARVAYENLRYPEWHFERQGHLLIMLHAVTLSSKGPSRRDLFADCRRLGTAASSRAATLLRR